MIKLYKFEVTLEGGEKHVFEGAYAQQDGAGTRIYDATDHIVFASGKMLTVIRLPEGENTTTKEA